MPRFLLLLLSAAVLFAQERPIVLKASTVLDGKGKTLHNTILIVEGAKIARIGGAVPLGAVVYDLSAFTVSPGWIDTHAHLASHFDGSDRLAGSGEPASQALLRIADNAVRTLNAGFTTVQSPGAPIDKDLRDAIARGVLPGPRVLTSLQPLTEASGDPDQLRALVRERKAQGADFIKLFASKSIREGGAQTMTDAQLQAACGEAKALGLRTLVHAHSPSSVKAATLAGCTSIEHGAYVTDDVFDLMAQHGTYYDPNIGVVLQNYLDNRPKYFGIGNYNAEGFAFMEKGVGIVLDTFKRALAHKNLKIIYGTDATAGAHGHNYREFIVRVRDGGQDPMAALISVTSLSAQSLNLGDQIGSLAPGMQADIVAFDGNPLEDATAAARAVFVMKAGKVYENLARGAKNGVR
ncbi:MAG TPA: amidohydrolase family protein [Bryobacteraceae bacterium]|nr:amidohydrolase family protein [Bryobacteraceae bacterium]HUO29321.1 amidohydrolase family protein [Bryobacteraceae bacterium]